MVTRWIIGLAAGPSLESLDAVLLEVGGLGFDLQARVAAWLAEPHPRELRELLVKVSTPGQADVRAVSLAHRVLGEAFGLAARRLADQASVSLQQVLCAGCAGCIAWHEGDGRYPSTLALGSAAVVAERTGLTTIADFRARDLACGGQGTPTGALADFLLFRDPRESRVVLHLGGIVQATTLPAGDDPRAVAGWELGPGNVLLDTLIQQASGGKERFDAGGKQAVQGRQIPELLGRWAHHPFLLRRPPKSLHRTVFAEEFARQTVLLAQQNNWGFHDLLCTATHFVARAAGEGLKRSLPRTDTPQRIILTGGGVRNGLLWRLLEEQLAGVPLEKSDALGMPAEARDATHAALLACLTLDGLPGNAPAATGASGPRLLGALTPGSPSNWLRCLAWMTGQHEEFEDED
jgi:anhydro-N-acetylmuramic acid kinase